MLRLPSRTPVRRIASPSAAAVWRFARGERDGAHSGSFGDGEWDEAPPGRDGVKLEVREAPEGG